MEVLVEGPQPGGGGVARLGHNLLPAAVARGREFPVEVPGAVDVPGLVLADRLARQVLLANGAGEAGGVEEVLAQPQALALDILAALLADVRLLRHAGLAQDLLTRAIPIGHLGPAFRAGGYELFPVGGADGSAQVGEEGVSGEITTHITPHAVGVKEVPGHLHPVPLDGQAALPAAHARIYLVAFGAAGLSCPAVELGIDSPRTDAAFEALAVVDLAQGEAAGVLQGLPAHAARLCGGRDCFGGSVANSWRWSGLLPRRQERSLMFSGGQARPWRHTGPVAG